MIEFSEAEISEAEILIRELAELARVRGIVCD
jgi:hypothetical protein